MQIFIISGSEVG